MPKAKEPLKEKRVMLALTPDLHEKLVAVARIAGVPTAAFARRILAEYLDSRADEISAALEADAAYQRSLEILRGNL